MRVAGRATRALVGTATVLALCGVVAVPARSGDPGRAKLPRPPRILELAVVGSAGRTLSVPAGGDLQAALDAAQPGDTVSLAAGAIFRGNFILRRKAGSEWIVVRSATSDEVLRPGARVTPASAPVMARLVTPNGAPALQAAPGARRYRLIGLELTVAADVARVRQIVAFGGLQSTLSGTPSDLILDRCYVHGRPDAEVFRGILLNSGAAAVVDSHVSEIHVAGSDSQAVLGYNGPGPFKIVNNHLEAAGENVMFGGGDPRIADLVPSDIEIRRNHLVKPLQWRRGEAEAGTRWTVKNLLELKNAQRVLIEGNVLENVWAESQGGAALVLTPRSDGAAPWTVVQDVMVRHNLIRNALGGFGGQAVDDGHPTRPLRRIAIVNNLWLAVDRAFFTIAVPAAAPVEDLVVDHNTAVPTRYFSYDIDPARSPALVRFQYTNNLTGFGVFGVKYPRTVADAARLTPDAVIGGNVLVRLGAVTDGRERPDGRPWEWDPARYRVLASAEEAGLNPDGTLLPTSPLKGRGTDGSDPGVDFDALGRLLGAPPS